MHGIDQNIVIQKLPHFSANGIDVAVMRLDLIHPVISGNKWFKLKYYLEDAHTHGMKTIATFGGAYSNHIIATAFAGKMNDLKTVGFIRGEAHKGSPASHTLLQAQAYGMELVFVDRQSYRDKQSLMQQHTDWLWVPEGGYGINGARGAAGILKAADGISDFSHVFCAVGTGTMLAGLISAALPHQQVTGISVLKGNIGLSQEVNALLTETEKMNLYDINHDYHFGGYAKHPQELLDFMRELWQLEQLPTDIVYTSKLLYGVRDMIKKGHFAAGSRLLLIHSGGLQGNASLPSDTLPF